MLDYIIYKARDNSGFVIYNKVSGETKYSKNLDDIDIVQANKEDKDNFTPKEQ